MIHADIFIGIQQVVPESIAAIVFCVVDIVAVHVLAYGPEIDVDFATFAVDPDLDELAARLIDGRSRKWSHYARPPVP